MARSEQSIDGVAQPVATLWAPRPLTAADKTTEPGNLDLQQRGAHSPRPRQAHADIRRSLPAVNLIQDAHRRSQIAAPQKRTRRLPLSFSRPSTAVAAPSRSYDVGPVPALVRPARPPPDPGPERRRGW